MAKRKTNRKPPEAVLAKRRVALDLYHEMKPPDVEGLAQQLVDRNKELKKAHRPVSEMFGAKGTIRLSTMTRWIYRVLEDPPPPAPPRKTAKGERKLKPNWDADAGVDDRRVSGDEFRRRYLQGDMSFGDGHRLTGADFEKRQRALRRRRK